MPKVSNIYQDKKSKKWYFVANLGFNKDGNRIRYWKRGFTTQKDARMAYNKYMDNFSDSAIKVNSTMYYKEFYYTYFEPDYRNSVSERTFENRIVSTRKHLSFFFHTKLKDLNGPQIKRWQNELSKHYSRGYVRQIFGSFQKSLDLAVSLGLLKVNIAKNVGNVKKDKKEVDFWTLEEFTKVVTTFNIYDYYEHLGFIFVWLMFMTGIRIGEAEALTWDDVDFIKKELTINKTMWYKGCGDYVIKPPKTRAGNRVISLDDKTVKYLLRWRTAQTQNVPSKFVLSYNGAPFPRSTAPNIIERHSKLAGVHKIKVHALRHSHVALLISMGENALVIRDRLGHEDIKTTLGTYGHLYPNTNKEVAQKLNSVPSVDDYVDHKTFPSNQYLKPYVPRTFSEEYLINND